MWCVGKYGSIVTEVISFAEQVELQFHIFLRDSKKLVRWNLISGLENKKIYFLFIIIYSV